MKSCKVCNNPVPPKPVGSGGSPKIYCSIECRRKNYWKKRSETNRKKCYCNVCGDEIPYQYQAGQRKGCCDDVCAKIWLDYRNGKIETLLPNGLMVLENDEKEQSRLYAMTLEEMGKELNISSQSARKEVSKALFKFWAVFEELYGKPDFGEPDNDCWDQLYNYIIEEEDHAPNPL